VLTEITLLGSGDMRSIPQPGCDCRNCLLAKNQYNFYRCEKRTNFSLLIRHNNRYTLIDAGPMIYAQLLNYYNSFLSFRDIDNILLTHDHFDHVGGIPLFYGNVKADGRSYELFCLKEVFQEIKSRYDWLFLTKNWKLFEYNEISFFEKFEIDGLKIMPIPMVHKVPTAGFVISFQSSEGIEKKIAIATDTKEIKEECKKFISGADLLFLGTVCEENKFPILLKGFFPDKPFREVFKREKVDHLTIEEAKEVYFDLRAKTTIAVHITHGNDTHDELSKRYDTEDFKIGYDGMTFIF